MHSCSRRLSRGEVSMSEESKLTDESESLRFDV